MLAAIELSKAYGERLATAAVSLTVQRGEVVGLVGPSGAGKTTIFALIAGTMKPDAGDIFLNGSKITNLPMFERARRGIGFLSQEPSLFPGLTVEQNILLALETLNISRDQRKALLDKLLGQFELATIRKQPGSKLSGGERRRAEIARALARRPTLLLLDEPFTGVDPIAIGGLKSLIRAIARYGIAVLLTDHNVREILGLVDRSYVLYNGRLVGEGSPALIAEDAYIRRIFLGADFRL